MNTIGTYFFKTLCVIVFFSIHYKSHAHNFDSPQNSTTKQSISNYPLEGYWPYGPARTSETWSNGASQFLLFGEGSALRVSNIDDPNNITVLSEVRTDHPVCHIDILEDGTKAVVSDCSKWVTLIDLQNLQSPSRVGTYEFESGRRPMGLAFKDNNTIIVAVAPQGLRALDISNPPAILNVGEYNQAATDFVFDVEILGNYAFIADDHEGVTAVDISDLGNMTLSTQFTGADGSSHISLSGTTAYVSRGGKGVSILDLDTSQSPVVITELGVVATNMLPDGFGAIYRAEVAANGLLAVADGVDSGLVLFDISNPAAATAIGGSDAPTFSVSIHENYAFATRTEWYSNHGVYVFDLNQMDQGAQLPPVELDYLPLLTNSKDVGVNGSVIMVSTENSGGVIIDASNPETPVTSSWIAELGSVNSTVKIGDTLVMGAYDRYLYLYDVSNLSNPVELPRFSLGAGGNVVYHIERVNQTTVAVATGTQGVKWVDLTDPQNPMIISSWVEINNSRINKITVQESLVVASSGTNAWVVDFSNLTIPQTRDNFSLASPILDTDMDGNYLYLANGIDGLRVWDISDPDNVFETADFDVAPSQLNGIKIHNSTAYLAADTFYGMLLVDINTPEMPTYISTIETSGQALKIDANDDIIALADNSNGVRIWAKQNEPPIFANGFEAP